MNKMKEVASLLGVELGEEFNIKNDCFSPFKLTNEGLVDGGGEYRPSILGYLLSGDCELEKLPFKPKRGERYWHYCTLSDSAVHSYWDSYSTDYGLFAVGNCFRTKDEALSKGKCIMMNIVREYESD